MPPIPYGMGKAPVRCFLRVEHSQMGIHPGMQQINTLQKIIEWRNCDLTTGEIMAIFRNALFTIIKLAAPILLTSVFVGLIISVIQAATQVHEQTLTFVPKLLAIGIMLLLFGNWMITQISDFTIELFSIISYSV